MPYIDPYFANINGAFFFSIVVLALACAFLGIRADRTSKRKTK